MKTYTVALIHKVHDWDASFTFPAPDARTARKWALSKLASPDWLVTKAQAVKAPGSAS